MYLSDPEKGGVHVCEVAPHYFTVLVECLLIVKYVGPGFVQILPPRLRCPSHSLVYPFLHLFLGQGLLIS